MQRRAKKPAKRCTLAAGLMAAIVAGVALQMIAVHNHILSEPLPASIFSPTSLSAPTVIPPSSSSSSASSPASLREFQSNPHPNPSSDPTAQRHGSQPTNGSGKHPLDLPELTSRHQLSALLFAIEGTGAVVNAHKGDVPHIPTPSPAANLRLITVDRTLENPPPGTNEEAMSSAAGGAPKLAGDAAHEAIGDATLDFLYLEYRHDSCDILGDIYKWWPKLKVGGYFSGGDYLDERTGRKTTKPLKNLEVCGAWGVRAGSVYDAVSDFRRAHRLKLSVTKDTRPSWVMRKGAVQESLEAPARPGTPRKLHFIWICSGLADPCPLPANQANVVQGWREMQPDWEVTVWDNALVRKEFPDQVDLLKKISIIAWASDILRYGILYRYGGVYLDTDTIALRPIDGLIEGDAPFGVCELPMSRWGMRYEEHCRFMCNGIMGTPPGEEMFKVAFETSQANVKLENPKMKVSWITGPKLFTNSTRWNITVLGATTFLPCSWKDTTICDIDRFKTIDNIYAMHSWTASWSTKEMFQNDSQWVPIWDRKGPGGSGGGGGKHSRGGGGGRVESTSGRQQRHKSWHGGSAHGS